MSLSDAKIRSIKPSDKPFKLTDSQGLYLPVNPDGSRLWYLKYRFTRKKCFEAVPLGGHKTNKKWSADYAERILARYKKSYLSGDWSYARHNAENAAFHGAAESYRGQRLSGSRVRIRRVRYAVAQLHRHATYSVTARTVPLPQNSRRRITDER